MVKPQKETVTLCMFYLKIEFGVKESSCAETGTTQQSISLNSSFMLTELSDLLFMLQVSC